MKKLSKLLSIFLAVLMIAGVIAAAPVTANAATPAWKTAYINYVNQVSKTMNDYGWFWLKDLDGNGIPELIWNSGLGLVGGTVSTFRNNELTSVTYGGDGGVMLLNNMVYASAGRQGTYTDKVYSYSNGNANCAFDGIMKARTDPYSVMNDDNYTFRYRLYQSDDYQYVTFSQYKTKLNSVFDTSKGGKLNYKNCYNSTSIITAINNYIGFISAPSVSLANQPKGINVAWGKVDNAAKYMVYFKKPSDTAWTKYTTTNNYYTLNSVISGQLYYVQVQGIAANGFKGSYSKVKGMTFIAQPTITGLTYNGNNNLSWKAVNGANKYQIARKKSGDTSYTYYTTSTNSFKESAVGGVAYTYQVRAMYATANSGTAYGAWSASKSVATLVAPTITSLKSQGNAVVAKWNSIKGATKYVVFFKTSSASKWNSATVAGTSLSITGVVSGTTYNVQVRAIGSTVNGPYSTVKSIKHYYAAPSQSTGTTYILNTNTYKFHAQNCRYVSRINSENKSVYTGTRQQVLNMGYEPCQYCNP